ncbi:MAG: hypothetical protein RBT71_03200 [Flavobacteriales bacterium]|jgi:hypothetical protein|nr:hypothetical protein [Flavobacteriales bacterium]
MRTIVLTALLLAATAGAHAQRRGDARGFRDRPATLGGGLDIGIPIGAFADSWGREIVGVSAHMGVPMRILPFDWGFDFAWGSMGGEKAVVAVDQDHLAPDTQGDLTVRSNVYGYHALLRLRPTFGKVSPYVEALGGLRHFTTRTKVRVDGLDKPLVKERNAGDFAWSSGWAAGVQVAPGRAFYVEGRVERINSGEVDYVDPASIVISPQGEVGFSTIGSPTRTVNVHIGIGFLF